MRFSFTTSAVERRELLIAWAVISLAFGIVIRPADTALFSFGLLRYILIAALTVGAGFLVHELAHKYFAQKYRCWAEFRSHKTMLFLALIMSLFGFILAAPGAVLIKGLVTKRQNGIISVAGPITNLALAVLFFPLWFLPGVLAEIGLYGFLINAWLALFNLIPFGFFDGSKVYRWSKPVYFTTAGIALVLVFLSSYLRVIL